MAEPVEGLTQVVLRILSSVCFSVSPAFVVRSDSRLVNFSLMLCDHLVNVIVMFLVQPIDLPFVVVSGEEDAYDQHTDIDEYFVHAFPFVRSHTSPCSRCEIKQEPVARVPAETTAFGS